MLYHLFKVHGCIFNTRDAITCNIRAVIEMRRKAMDRLIIFTAAVSRIACVEDMAQADLLVMVLSDWWLISACGRAYSERPRANLVTAAQEMRRSDCVKRQRSCRLARSVNVSRREPRRQLRQNKNCQYGVNTIRSHKLWDGWLTFVLPPLSGTIDTVYTETEKEKGMDRRGNNRRWIIKGAGGTSNTKDSSTLDECNPISVSVFIHLMFIILTSRNAPPAILATQEHKRCH